MRSGGQGALKVTRREKWTPGSSQDICVESSYPRARGVVVQARVPSSATLDTRDVAGKVCPESDHCPFRCYPGLGFAARAARDEQDACRRRVTQYTRIDAVAAAQSPTARFGFRLRTAAFIPLRCCRMISAFAVAGKVG